jgi:Rv0078B-related antitoxin
MSKSLTPGQRLSIALDLHDFGVKMMRQNLRRRYPDATNEEIEKKLLEWLHTRPGAEYGDGVGKPRASLQSLSFCLI